MGFFSRFKRKAKLPTAAPTAQMLPGSDATTTADRPDFTLSVPFRWEAVPSEEGYEFRNQTLPEQIIVTVLPHKREMGVDELEEVVTGLVALRRKAIGELSAGKARVGETVLVHSEGQVEARVIGEDTPNKVRLAFVIRGTPKKTVTVALTRYMLDEIGAPFEDYARVVFDLLKVKTT
jgi:hypothetical protein